MTHADMAAPLVVSARLDPDSFQILDGLRRRHFPAHLNKIPAHISLFHHLPGEHADDVIAVVRRHCQAIAPIELSPLAPRRLGRGVAFAYESAALSALHRDLAAVWRAWLTPQDRQPFKPHVTIQNKAEPAAASALYAALADQLPPHCRVDGIDIHRYVGGPWAPVESCAFAVPSGGRG